VLARYETGLQPGYYSEEIVMATTKQKQAARKNIAKARTAQSARAQGKSVPRKSRGLTTAQQNDLPDSAFAFTKQRKEPLTDAKHVRNAVARFDQVEGVSDADRDKAWRKIRSAARKYDVELSERGWRQLFEGGKARKK
jgi:hypothetical protein